MNAQHGSKYPVDNPCASLAGRSRSCLESELENICRELALLDGKIGQLLEQQTALSRRRDDLSTEIVAQKKRRVLPQRDWAGDDFEWSESSGEMLRNTFRIRSWRENQKEIVNATISGRDVFVVMRTGGGKSLCYQLPALLRGGITVVVSPLLSLIEDQTRYLNDLVPGSAAMLSASMDKTQTADVYRRMRGEHLDGDSGHNELVMVLLTPEKVVKSKMFMAALDKTAKNGRLARVVIDEAHCCSQWGHDFRPEYCKLGILKRQFTHVPVLAVTATCTDFIRNDVMKILNLTPADVVCFKSSFNRSNLRYEVMDKAEAAKDALEQLAAFIKGSYHGKTGIVYAFSRKEASDVAAGLASRGIPAAYYHAGQDEGDRSRIQQAWMRGDVPVIVATIAFGMGINHLEVRFVVHFSISKSLENYYQESGIAGRDGRPSRCVIFYRPSDVSRQATLSCQDQGSQPLATLHKIVTYCQAIRTCRRRMIAEALGEQGGQGLCARGCDVCSGTVGHVKTIDASRHAKTLVRILRHVASKEQRVTPRQLVEAWRVKKGAKAMPPEVVNESDRPQGLHRSGCERLVLHLLGLGVLSDDFHFTAFSIVHYVVTGARAHALESGRLPAVSLDIPAEDGPARGASGASKSGAGERSSSRRSTGDANVSSPRGMPVQEHEGLGKKRAKSDVRRGSAVVDLCDSEDEDAASGRDGSADEGIGPRETAAERGNDEGQRGEGEDAQRPGQFGSLKKRSIVRSSRRVGDDDDFETTKPKRRRGKGKAVVEVGGSVD